MVNPCRGQSEPVAHPWLEGKLKRNKTRPWIPQPPSPPPSSIPPPPNPPPLPSSPPSQFPAPPIEPSPPPLPSPPQPPEEVLCKLPDADESREDTCPVGATCGNSGTYSVSSDALPHNPMESWGLCCNEPTNTVGKRSSKLEPRYLKEYGLSKFQPNEDTCAFNLNLVVIF